jgi:hypothetical protein
MAPNAWRGLSRFVLWIVPLLALTAALVLDVSTHRSPTKPPVYYVEVTYNAPYIGGEPGHASIIYNFVTYYVATTNKAEYSALLNLDGAGTVWAVIPASSIPAEWTVPCPRGSDTTVWSTEAPGYKHAARAYCDGTFGPGIGHWGQAVPPGCHRTWREVTSPRPTSNFTSGIAIAAVSPSDIWTVAEYGFWPGGGSLASHFNGKTWAAVPTPNLGAQQFAINGLVALATDDIWAVGFAPGPQALIEHYDGTSWTVVPGPQVDSPASMLNAVSRVAGRNELWAVGQFSTGIATKTLTEHYDGGNWSIVPSPNVGTFSNLLSVSADSGDDVWAVGSHADGKAAETLIEHYDGRQWSVMASYNVGWPSDANRLNGVLALSASDVWAVGTSMALDGNSAYTHIEHYDGTRWLSVQSPDPGLSVLYGLAAASPKDVWAVGYYEHGDADYTHTLVEHFDGSIWTVVPTPYIDRANASFVGVTLIPNKTELWAVGVTNDSVGNKPATYSHPLIESLTWNC